MKDRLIDTSLLVVLILVAMAIFWTLLNSFGIALPSLNLGFGSRTLSQTSPAQTASPELTDVVAVLPDGSNPNDLSNAQFSGTSVGANGVIAVDPNEVSQSEDISETQSIQEQTATEASVEISNETSTQAVPEGALTLERIGSSYAGDVKGACNVTLEPLKHVAVSRDILATYPCGTTLTLHLDKAIEGKNSFQVVVGDTMGTQNVKTVNLYAGSQEKALSYGVNEGWLEPQ